MINGRNHDAGIDEELAAVERQLREVPKPPVPESLLDDLLAIPQPVKSRENGTMALRGRRSPANPDGLGGPSYKTTGFKRLRNSIPNAAGANELSHPPFRQRRWLAVVSVVGSAAVVALVTMLTIDFGTGENDRGLRPTSVADTHITPTLTRFFDDTDPCHILPPMPDGQ